MRMIIGNDLVSSSTSSSLDLNPNSAFVHVLIISNGTNLSGLVTAEKGGVERRLLKLYNLVPGVVH